MEVGPERWLDANGNPLGAALSEVGRLVSVAMKHARDAFIDEATIRAQWQALNFLAPPDLRTAVDEYERFLEIFYSSHVKVHFLRRSPDTTLDSIYARDASIAAPNGMILGRMGKAARYAEPEEQEHAFSGPGFGTRVAGRITAHGLLEGGDVIWLDQRTIVIGLGYRTNREGISQVRALAGPGVDVIEVPLPHWNGERDVMHLMSLISPVDRHIAVVYSRLLPVPFRQLLLDRGYRLIEVPDDEFVSMGCNVLALAPGRCVMLSGNPGTRTALERAGVEVIEYAGNEISVKGSGGPTCLTRPLVREAV